MLDPEKVNKRYWEIYSKLVKTAIVAPHAAAWEQVHKEIQNEYSKIWHDYFCLSPEERNKPPEERKS